MVFPVVGGDGKPTGYEVENSLRFDNPDDPNLSTTFSSAGNRRTFTISAWIKKGDTSADRTLIGQGGTSTGNPRGLIFVGSTLRFTNNTSGSSTDTDVETNAKLRDHSAWYHVVAAVDTTQGTAANRIKLYINGEQQTSLATATYPDQNFEMNWNNNVLHTVGRYPNNDAYHMDGHISEFYFIDGTQYAASNFGETDDNGVWIPKDASGDLTFGTNGFYLEFKQTGTGTNSSGMGADTSGNDNHLAVNNLAALDVTVDTPTNNFATLNPLINSNGTYTLSEGNTKFVADGSNGWNTTTATMGFSKGKWYWEQKFTQVTGSASFAGLVKDDVNHADDDISGQDDSEGVLYYATGNYMFGSSGTYVSGGASFGNSWGDAGDIISVAADFDNNKMYFAKNGTYQGSGNPSTGSNGLPISEGAQGLVAGSFSFVFPYAGAYYANDGCEWNFGNAPFSISSGNSDANGYGNFEYSVPSGYYALCTKNLAEYG
jgi:hypothetical protein